MFAEATEEFAVSNAGLVIYVENADDVYEKAIQHGSSAVTPVADQSYGRSGGIKGLFCNTWWITSVLPTQVPSI